MNQIMIDYLERLANENYYLRMDGYPYVNSFSDLMIDNLAMQGYFINYISCIMNYTHAIVEGIMLE